MIIGITGTKCIGKSTLIKDIKTFYPMYKTLDEDYRTIGEKLDSEGDEASQRAIRDYMFEQAKKNYRRSNNIIHDRTLLDNLAYTMHLYNTTDRISDDFVVESFGITKKAMEYYDMIFTLLDRPENQTPIREGVCVETRTSINHIIANLFFAYYEESGQFKKDLYPEENCCVPVEIFGDQLQRIEMIRQYMDDDGSVKEGDQSSIMDYLGNYVNSKKSNEDIPKIEDFM